MRNDARSHQWTLGLIKGLPYLGTIELLAGSPAFSSLYVCSYTKAGRREGACSRFWPMKIMLGQSICYVGTFMHAVPLNKVTKSDKSNILHYGIIGGKESPGIKTYKPSLLVVDFTLFVLFQYLILLSPCLYRRINLV